MNLGRIVIISYIYRHSHVCAQSCGHYHVAMGTGVWAQACMVTVVWSPTVTVAELQKSMFMPDNYYHS